MTLSATTASAKKVIGIALETTPGTAVAPTYWLRVSKVSAKDETTPLTDETFQGDRAAVHQIVPGTIHSKVSITMPVALDTAGFAFAGILASLFDLCSGNSWIDQRLAVHLSNAIQFPAFFINHSM